MKRLLVGLLVAVAVIVGATVLLTDEAGTPAAEPTAKPTAAVAPKARSTRTLAGRVVVLDAGHQLGNHNFLAEINAPTKAGGFEKECNTTGTSTDDGFPEATFNFDVSVRAKRALEKLGAKVVMTRTTNSEQEWGPCVDVRGKAGNSSRADLKISIHADGSYDGGGFHVIAPELLKGWTDDIHDESMALSKVLRTAMEREGFERASYVAGGDGLDERGDLATLNLSDIPVAMLESGNMRNPDEAVVMASPRGRQRYADALVAGVRAYLLR